MYLDLKVEPNRQTRQSAADFVYLRLLMVSQNALGGDSTRLLPGAGKWVIRITWKLV